MLSSSKSKNRFSLSGCRMRGAPNPRLRVLHHFCARGGSFEASHLLSRQLAGEVILKARTKKRQSSAYYSMSASERIWVSSAWLYCRSICSSVWSFWTSEAVGAGRTVGVVDGGASSCAGAGCRGVNAAASARGQADSVVAGAAGGGDTTFRGATGAGAGAKRLLRALEGPERSTAGGVAAPFGSRRHFTRAINSCG